MISPPYDIDTLKKMSWPQLARSIAEDKKCGKSCVAFPTAEYATITCCVLYPRVLASVLCFLSCASVACAYTISRKNWKLLLWESHYEICDDSLTKCLSPLSVVYFSSCTRLCRKKKRPFLHMLVIGTACSVLDRIRWCLCDWDQFIFSNRAEHCVYIAFVNRLWQTNDVHILDLMRPRALCLASL